MHVYMHICNKYYKQFRKNFLYLSFIWICQLTFCCICIIILLEFVYTIYQLTLFSESFETILQCS